MVRKQTVEIYLKFILFHVIFGITNCVPVEVTGKNIKYYKLTPNEGSGSYNFNYGTKDGAERSERGFVKHSPESKEPLLVVSGSFKYPDANEVFYIADEQGYRIVSKEEIDELHNKSTDIPAAKSSVSPSNIQGSIPEGTPKTESPVIVLNIVKPAKPKDCPPDECTSSRESKIFKIKSLKFG